MNIFAKRFVAYNEASEELDKWYSWVFENLGRVDYGGQVYSIDAGTPAWDEAITIIEAQTGPIERDERIRSCTFTKGNGWCITHTARSQIIYLRKYPDKPSGAKMFHLISVDIEDDMMAIQFKLAML